MDRFDSLMLRCPRLGGEVTFAYCRREQGTLPCRMTISCWQGFIPAEEHLRKHLSDEEWDRCFNTQPKDRLSAILEIAGRVKGAK